MSIAPEQPTTSEDALDKESMQIAANLSQRRFDLPSSTGAQTEQDKTPAAGSGIISAISEFDKKHPVLTRTAAATAALVGGSAAIDAFSPNPETAIVAEDSRPIEQTAIMEAMDAAYDTSLRVGEPIVIEVGPNRLYGEAVARISSQPGYGENEPTILDVIDISTRSIGVYHEGEVFGVYPVDLNGDGKLEYIVKEESGEQLPDTPAFEG